MRRPLCSLLSVLTAFALCAIQAGETPESYLADGKLKERIEVQELQGGAVGFTGLYYAIEPDGSWSAGSVSFRQKGQGEPKAKGVLSQEQLTQLAKDLARCELAHVPNHGAPEVNPRVIVVIFGKKRTELQPERGNTSEAEDKAIRDRYDGILRAVKALCKDSKKE
jgi:hypothetical protein